MRLDTPVQKLKGLGPKAAELLAKKEILTVGDLLCFYPAEYEYFAEPETIAKSDPGSLCTLRLTMIGSGSVFRKGARVISHFEGADGTGKVRLTFFNMPYVRQTLAAGTTFVFRGMLRQAGNGSLYMEQPRFFTIARYTGILGTLQPRYRQIKGIGDSRMRKFLQTAIEETEGIRDDIPDRMREKYGLIGQREAVRTIHFPPDREKLQAARRRLIFDEFFLFIVGVRRQKNEEGKRLNPRPMRENCREEDGRSVSFFKTACNGDMGGSCSQVPGKSGWTDRLLESLPFTLTQEQMAAWEEIRTDLTGPWLMNRLLQGDVGSGKTILAFLALVLCAENGRQGALMAPTEVLARQHMDGFTEYMEKSGLPVRAVLLTAQYFE